MILEEEGNKLATYLNKNTKYKYRVVVPVSYVAVVEALGSKRADIAMINTFGYHLAHERYGATAKLTGVNKGSTTYQGQILARADGIKRIEELHGKKIAYVDPASTSGFILPSKLLEENKITPKDYVFAGRHDSAIIMLYQGQVDAAASYYTPAENGEPQDARKLVKPQFPDIYEKVKVIKLTESIPNDPVAFRKGLSSDLVNVTISALKKYSKTPDGKVSLKKMYNMTDFVDTNDANYDRIRKIFIEYSKKQIK